MHVLRAIPNVCWSCIRAILFNPIVGKELRVSARRRRTYWLRGVYLTFAVVVMLLAWWTIVQAGDGGVMMLFDESEGRASQLQARSLVGRQLSVVLGWTQLLAFILLSPVLTSSAISDEIEDRTLHVLLITPLTSFQIVTGKVLSRLAHVFLLVLLSIPLLLAMRLYGGFDLLQLMQIELLCLASSIFGASVGLLMSCWEKKAWRAVAMSYFWIGLWWLALPIAFLVGCRLLIETDWFSHLGWVDESVAVEWMTFATGAFVPIAGMAYLTEDLVTGGMPDMVGASPTLCLTSLAVHVVFSLLLMYLSVVLVRRRGSLTEEENGSRSKRKAAKRNEVEHVVGVPSREHHDHHDAEAAAESSRGGARWAVVRWAHAMVERLDPLVLREMQTRLFRRRWERIVALSAVGLLLVWFYVWGKPWDYPEANLAVIWTGILLALILSAVLSALPITSEKQSRTWEPLLCTPAQPARILLSKLAGVWCKAALPLLFVGLHLFLFLPSRFVSSTVLIHAVMLGVMCVLLSSTSGLCCSMLCRRTGTALMLNLGVLFLAWIILPMMASAVMVLWLDGEGRAYTVVTSAVLWLNPLYWMGTVLGPGVFDFAGHYHYEVDIPELSLSGMEMTLVLLIPFALSLIVSASVLSLCVLMFDRLTGRPTRGPLRFSRFALS